MSYRVVRCSGDVLVQLTDSKVDVAISRGDVESRFISIINPPIQEYVSTLAAGLLANRYDGEVVVSGQNAEVPEGTVTDTVMPEPTELEKILGMVATIGMIVHRTEEKVDLVARGLASLVKDKERIVRPS